MIKEIIGNITQEDIDNGKMGNCFTCPIAISFNRELQKTNPSLYVAIGIKKLSIFDKDNIFDVKTLELSNELRQFRQAFDSYKSVNPIEYLQKLEN